MMPTLIGLSGVLAVLAVLFYSLEKIFPAIRDKPILRRDALTDLIYWFFNPFVARLFTQLAVGVVVVVVALILGRELGPRILNGFGPVARQPFWLIAVELLVLGDFLGYWTHRLFHGRRLWRFHAVHHSSRQLDWLSSARLHPVNEALGAAVRAAPLFALGFPLAALAGYLPFLTLYAVFLHANVPWDFGPLRYVIASPRFHRWHHTAEEEGLDKNFAGLFPVFDLIFGTFYMPKDRQPQIFGVHNEEVPRGFLGQLWYPFSKKKPAGPPPVPGPRS